MAEKTAEKKKNILVRAFQKVVRFLRDTRGEMKKVVWPSRKQVMNNFIVVCVFVAICAVLILGLDYIFGWLMSFVLNLGVPAA